MNWVLVVGMGGGYCLYGGVAGDGGGEEERVNLVDEQLQWWGCVLYEYWYNSMYEPMDHWYYLNDKCCGNGETNYDQDGAKDEESLGGDVGWFVKIGLNFGQKSKSENFPLVFFILLHFLHFSSCLPSPSSSSYPHHIQIHPFFYPSPSPHPEPKPPTT